MARLCSRSGRRTLLLVALAALSAAVGVLLSSSKPSVAPHVARELALRGDGPSSSWLPKSLLIVDADLAGANRFAKPFRDSGFAVETRDAASFDVANTSADVYAAVWFTSRAVPQLRVDVVRDTAARVPVLLDGPSALADELLALQPSESMVDRFWMNDAEVHLDKRFPVRRTASSVRSAGSVRSVAGSAGSTTSSGRVFAKTTAGTPMLIAADNVMWSAVPLTDGANLERMPYLALALEEQFHLEPIAERRDIDLYLDPDLEPGTTPEQFATKWREAGIRRVYLAAWKDNRASNWSFDYKQFVDTMHRSDIEVFAWLEWPHVNFSFWEQHPQCIEYTGTGKKAQIFWRQHISLEAPGCLDRAYEETKVVLDMASWDGVNLAELYFEPAGEGPANPAEYTPFHPVVREEFKRLHGFDPREIVRETSPHFWKRDQAGFAAWNAYREELLNVSHRRILEKLRTHRAGKQIMITAIDDRNLLPGRTFRDELSVGQNVGANTKSIVAIANEFDAEYQVEDPFTMWVESPNRYSKVGRLYPDVAPGRLLLDINVVDRPTALDTGFTMYKTGGFELMTSVASVAESGARLALYASSSTRDADLRRVKYAMAGGSVQVARLQEDGSTVRVASAWPFTLRLTQPASFVAVDGVVHPLAEPSRSVDLPAGTHKVGLS